MLKRAERPRVDVALRTVETLQRLLEGSPVPVSRNWLLDRLRASGHATTRARLNRGLSFFFELGLAVEGSKGIQWTHTTSRSLQLAVASGRRV